MLKILVVAILSIVLSTPTMATSTKIYVWRNEQGVLVFSDSPRPGAEEVEVNDKQNIIPSVGTSVLDITPKTVVEDYQVEITQPEEQGTVRDNTGSVYISALIKPRFKRGLRIQLYLDGEPYEKPSTKSIFILRNVFRGEHQIKMDVIDETGKVIASSKPRTFFMHRASVIKAN